MVPTRKLAQLLDRTRPDTKIILVGDHHQLPEIGAGGVLRGLVERCDDIPTLTENRRQTDLAERDALADVRDGDVRNGLDWYLASGRVTPAVDMADARTALVDAWWTDRSNGRTDQLMMAERRVDVARLNDAARRRFADAGLLGEQRIHAADRDYATGDLVMFGRNDYGLGVRNGERGHITALDPATDTITVTIEGREVPVPRTYLDGGHLVWGYAATVHKNQGATCDHGYLLASDALYRELGYVALSRGRIDNRIWTVTTGPDHDDDIEHAHYPAPTPDRDPIAELVASMERSAAHQLAIDEAKRLPQPLNPGEVDVDELLDRRDRIGADLYRTAPPRVHTELADAERRYRLAERRLDHADDHEWAARTASLDEARDQLDEYAAMQARFDTWAIDHADQLTERRALDRQIRDVLAEMTIAIEQDPPPMVVDQLGQPPVGVDARNEWRAAVVDMAIAAHYDQVGDQPEPAPHRVDDLDIV
ncbi:MAG: hypothetical protein CL424_15285 [Acidimicrobiaceae bacterium]|nr:hypothetical protein [Acidimicrobiaceae bacterium]